jgi:hypothetical protein
MYRLLLFIFLLLTTACENHLKSESIYEAECKNTPYEKVTLTDLRNHPDKYDGKKVELYGFYKGYFEMSALFIKKSANNAENAIWVRFGDNTKLINQESGLAISDSLETMKLIGGKKMKLLGVFDKNEKGHLNQYFGTLKQIRYCEIYY